MSQSTTDRMPQLDGLRALALLAVLLHHTTFFAHDAMHLGVYGVHLFFVLSGFLITGILLKARETRGPRARIWLAFYARRMVRIFPLYYLVIVAGAVLNLPHIREALFWHATYATNLVIFWEGAWPGAPANHLWTLAVEEQFYLVWPLVVLFTPRRLMLPATLGAMALGPLARLAIILAGGAPVQVYVFPLSSLDLLCGGALLALIQPAERGRFAATCLYVGAPLLALVLVIGGPAARVGFNAANALICIWIVSSAAAGVPGTFGKLLESPPLVYLGSISYGMYLFHEFIPGYAEVINGALQSGLQFPQVRGPDRFLLVSALSLVVASLSWHLFEKPLNDLKRYFPYTRPGAERS